MKEERERGREEGREGGKVEGREGRRKGGREGGSKRETERGGTKESGREKESQRQISFHQVHLAPPITTPTWYIPYVAVRLRMLPTVPRDDSPMESGTNSLSSFT